MSSSFTATCCGVPAAISTTRIWLGRWPGSATRSHLLCQDKETKIEGVEIHRPEIGGLLPVYVKDPYEGFEVKTFAELTDAELDFYLEANVAAVREVAAAAGGIDAALANHLVMGPAILARAGVAPFAAKIHGSALEYTVKPSPADSSPSPTKAWKRPPESSSAPATRRSPSGRRSPTFLTSTTRPGSVLRGLMSTSSARREADREGPGANTPLVAFVGKLIVSKGVDLLIAAWPLVKAAHPGLG